MSLNNKRAELQSKALNNWLNANKFGTCEMPTGTGKTFVALHALSTMSPKGKHLFLAETVQREKDLKDDIVKFNTIFPGKLDGYVIEFQCYQTVYKWKNMHFGLVIADEIHDSLTPAYSNFYKYNTYDAIIGLSATINRKTAYDDFTKGDLLDKIAPVVFKYTVDDAIEDGIQRDLQLYVIQHKLDSVNKVILSGSKQKPFYQTEQAAYSYWDKEHKKAWYIQDEDVKKFKIRITSTKRSQILYNLQSKVPIVKELLNNIKGKSIVFSNSLDSLEKITPNVVSSKEKEDVNERIREDFDNDKIRVIGSFKKLKQGANLKGLDNAIIMSYYSTEKDLIQRIGRLRNNGKVGHIFILLTSGTQEEVWFSKMISNIESLDLIYCPDVNFAIKKYNDNK